MTTNTSNPLELFLYAVLLVSTNQVAPASPRPLRVSWPIIKMVWPMAVLSGASIKETEAQESDWLRHSEAMAAMTTHLLRRPQLPRTPVFSG